MMRCDILQREQIIGPYSFWHHTHRIEPRDGGSLLCDEVRYALPVAQIGPARDLVHTFSVRPSLERIFDYRQQVFTGLSGGIPESSKQASPALLAKQEITA
jgi:ligand-binding SRPBCC domain-containing protein